MSNVTYLMLCKSLGTCGLMQQHMLFDRIILGYVHGMVVTTTTSESGE